MASNNLNTVAQAVVRRTQRQGFIVPREIREELTRAGVAEGRWKEVVPLAGASLKYRHGRYYFVSPAVTRLRDRVRQEQRQTRQVHRVVRGLIAQFQSLAEGAERREHPRITFVQPVRVLTAEEGELNFITKDLSLSGICLIGNRSLKGQTVRLVIPVPTKPEEHLCLVVRILWASTLGDGLVQQGGLFVEVVDGAVQDGRGPGK